uniref:MutL C-terminal dimerisation domain-containing protein n=1 Tax=Timema tahoe TaxID=61484 RepID=A0A7R9IJ10_9NEOP|nr:unnamed protein product [Timema tahoe]
MDRKFIVTLASVAGSKKPHVIVLFDQHAVHERIRLEKLMKDYQIDGCNTHFRSTEITPPLPLSLSAKEVRILSSFEEEFGRLGLYYQLTNETQIYVTKIPTCLKARESREASRGNTVVKSLLEALIREQVEVLLDTRGVGTRVPSVLQNIISSEACRGAVKFGHELSVEESRVLLKYLGQCELPFQCAHGRPALAPIADLAIIDRDTAPVRDSSLLASHVWGD